MKTFKQFIADSDAENADSKLAFLFEHEVYRRLPGTKNSYRLDAEETAVRVPKHAHVYARPKGQGTERYSVRVDGRGHDGSSGISIPKAHADYFREKGFEIKVDNILEELELKELDEKTHRLQLLMEVDS